MSERVSERVSDPKRMCQPNGSLLNACFVYKQWCSFRFNADNSHFSIFIRYRTLTSKWTVSKSSFHCIVVYHFDCILAIIMTPVFAQTKHASLCFCVPKIVKIESEKQFDDDKFSIIFERPILSDIYV